MLEDRLIGWRHRADVALARVLPDPDQSPHRLHAAMRHAVLLGGKRMRPLLVHASGALFGADEALLDAPAAAVELIHAYSLVHDDLPAMDDDALRRGQPTVHVAFDEATAILAGDALQSLAFAVLADAPTTDAVRVALLRSLAEAAGAAGMCGGQALDIDATGQLLAHLVEHEAIALTEQGQRARARADHADAQGVALGSGERGEGAQAGGHRGVGGQSHQFGLCPRPVAQPRQPRPDQRRCRRRDRSIGYD